MNLLQVAKTFATEDMALAYWIMTRWPDGVGCLACDNAGVCHHHQGQHWQSVPPVRVRRVRPSLLCDHWHLFHDSQLPLTKWFAAIALMCEAKKGVSANQVARHLGVSYKWFDR